MTPIASAVVANVATGGTDTCRIGSSKNLKVNADSAVDVANVMANTVAGEVWSSSWVR
jgi:hypothetical protein